MKLLSNLDPRTRGQAALALFFLGPVLSLFVGMTSADADGYHFAVGMYLLIALLTWGPALALVWNAKLAPAAPLPSERKVPAKAGQSLAQQLQAGRSNDGSVLQQNYEPSNRQERRAKEKADRRAEGQKNAALKNGRLAKAAAAKASVRKAA